MLADDNRIKYFYIKARSVLKIFIFHKTSIFHKIYIFHTNLSIFHNTFSNRNFGVT